MTAVEFIEQRLQVILKEYTSEFIHIEYVLEQAKELERNQIIDANIAGMEFIPVDPNKYKQDAEDYYTQTYQK